MAIPSSLASLPAASSLSSRHEYFSVIRVVWTAYFAGEISSLRRDALLFDFREALRSL